MPANKDFALRIEIMDECFRNNMRRWTLDSLVETINEHLMERYGKKASRRTIQNDLKFLMEEKDAPIIRTREGTITYYSYKDKSFSIFNLPVPQEGINLLKDAIGILEQVNEFQILSDVRAVINQLANTVATSANHAPLSIQFERHTTAAGSLYIDELYAAVRNKVVLRIEYQPFSAEHATEIIFHPYLLREYRNRWFLMGRSADAQQVTTLALDRIRKIRNSSIAYVENDLFEPAAYFNNVIGVTIPQGEQVQEIYIKVAAKQVPYILTKPIHHTQEVLKKYRNGDILVRVWLIINYELRAVLLSYGCDIIVEQPDTLRNSIKEVLQSGLNCYR